MASLFRGLLVLTLVLAAVAVAVSAATWMPFSEQKTNQDEVKEGTGEAVDRAKSWKDWATKSFPYTFSSTEKQMNEKLDTSSGESTNVAGKAEENVRTAGDIAREYAAKGYERMTSTKDQLHGTTKGYIQKWGTWVNENVGALYELACSRGEYCKSTSESSNSKRRLQKSDPQRTELLGCLCCCQASFSCCENCPSCRLMAGDSTSIPTPDRLVGPSNFN